MRFFRNQGFHLRPVQMVVGFLVLSFLVQASGFGTAFSPAPAIAAPTNGTNSTTSSINAPDQAKPGDKHSDKHLTEAKVQAVSGVDEMKQMQQQVWAKYQQQFGSQQPTKKAANSSNPIWRATTGNSNPTSDATSAAQPRVVSTYYANKKADDAGIDPGDCTTLTNSDCSIRAALSLASSDSHGTVPDLVLITTTTTYTATNSLNVPPYVNLSSTSNLSCPNTNATLDFSAETTGNGLVIGDHDYVNNMFVQNSQGDGLVINGSFNQVTCFGSVANAGNGITINPGASSNQIGGINPTVNFGAAPIEVGFTANGNYGLVITGSNTISNVVEDTGVGYIPGFGPIGNSSGGILIEGGASNNQIGGNANRQRNYIGANSGSGVIISDPNTQGNKLYNNYIGTDSTGTIAVPDTLGLGAEVFVSNGASNNIIGGDRNGGYGNLINGVDSLASVAVSNASGTTIQGNLVNVSASLTGTIGFSLASIFVLQGSQNTTIGGREDNTSRLGNIVGGGFGAGIAVLPFLGGGLITNTALYGNYVGTDPNGGVLTNTLGIIVQSVNGVQIGGGGPGQGNFVGGNAESGIDAQGTYTDTTGVVIQSNTIGIKPDHSGPLYNGTSASSSPGSTCSPSGGASLSEFCDGITILSDAITNTAGYIFGPITQIYSNTIAANNSYSGSDGAALGAAGIRLDYVNGSTIQGNSIGAYASGSTVISYPTNIGIALFNGSSNNQIGGDRSLGQGNLLAASLYSGVYLQEQSFDKKAVYGSMNGNRIQGNAIGVDQNGNYNANFSGIGGYTGNSYGVELLNYVPTQTLSSNLVGVDFGVTSPNLNQGNLIGSQNEGIYLGGQNGGLPSDSNKLNGNYIGINAAGTSASAGNTFGIDAEINLTNTQLQANYVGATNIPTTTTTYGLYLYGPVTSTTIINNYIGTNAAGANFGTQYNLWLDDAYNPTSAGPSQTFIKNNVIAFGLSDGVLVGDAVADPSPAQRNTISQNSIYGNKGLGINLNYITGTTGVKGGSPTGPNNQADSPFLTGAVYANNSFTISGTTNPGSILELFLADNSPDPQGQTFIGTLPTSALDSSGNFNNANVTVASGVTIPNNPRLVATSTLLTPSAYAGSTSQFSPVFNGVTAPVLSASPNNLTFTAVQGTSPASQTVNLNVSNNPTSFTTSTNYTSGSSGWLTVSPTTGTVAPGTPTPVTLTVNSSSLTTGVYTATVIFSDSIYLSDMTSVVVTLTITAPVTPPPPPTYTYYLPLLANTTNTAVGSTTTYVTFQNLSSSAGVTISIQYYNLGNGATTGSQSVTLPAKGQQAILPNIGVGNSADGIITSNQPLNVVVSESLNSGGSAYNVTGQAAATLYSPLALNGAFGGFSTNITVFNVGGATSTGTIQFYDESGNPAASQSFNIPSHASQTLNQRGLSGLSSNHSYWAKITGGASDSLTAQVIEFGPLNFVATFNASVPTLAVTTQFAPAVFNGLYGYVTGMGFANPNSTATSVTVTYYDLNGNALTSPAAISIPANGSGSLYQGLPGTAASVASARVDSTQPLVMTVNERGPASGSGTYASGTYTGIANGSTSVALPVMANGFASFFTGATILNVGSGTANVMLTYLNPDGSVAGTSQSNPNLAANASFGLYQGAGSQGLNSNFFGTALISSNQPLIVTTNALQAGTGLFYTYTEPSK